MKCKVVSDGEKFKVLVKQFPLFWWTDPGFPAFDSYEKADHYIITGKRS